MTDAKTAEPLDVVARKIEQHAKKSDEHVIAAAMLMREARRRVEDGEAGDDIKWYAWALEKIKLSKSRLRDLQRIAAADDPAKELERQRKLMQKRVEKHREKKAAEKHELEEERQDLIAWAKKAPIERVRWVLRLTASNDNAVRSIEERPHLGSQQAV